jgi:hypothetical protein
MLPIMSRVRPNVANSLPSRNLDATENTARMVSRAPIQAEPAFDAESRKVDHCQVDGGDDDRAGGEGSAQSRGPQQLPHASTTWAGRPPSAAGHVTRHRDGGDRHHHDTEGASAPEYSTGVGLHRWCHSGSGHLGCIVSQQQRHHTECCADEAEGCRRGLDAQRLESCGWP